MLGLPQSFNAIYKEYLNVLRVKKRPYQPVGPKLGVIMVKVCIYVRTSTKEHQDTSMQKSQLLDYCKAREFEVFKIYEDHGYSGTNQNRPGFKKMIKDAKKGKFKAIIVWKLDRFARSLQDLIMSIQELSEYGVAFISYKDSFDLSTAQGKLMMQLIGAFAEFEADLIRSRVKSGIAHAKLNGTKSGKPIGREKTINDGKIRQLFDLGWRKSAIAEHMDISMRSVGRALNK